MQKRDKNNHGHTRPLTGPQTKESFHIGTSFTNYIQFDGSKKMKTLKGQK